MSYRDRRALLVLLLFIAGCALWWARPGENGGRPCDEPCEVVRTAAEPQFITGSVVDPSGAPAAGVTVLAFLANREPAPALDQGALASTISDADGRFQFADLEPGVRYAVTARVSKAPAIDMVRALGWTRSAMERDVVIQLHQGTVLRGRALGAKGLAVGAVLVQAMEKSWPSPFWGYEWPQQAVGWRTPWIASDDDGRFVIEGVPPGACLVRCVSASLGEATVYASPTQSEVRVALRQPDGARLSGTVLGPRGAVAGARISVTWRSERADVVHTRAEATSGPDGTYSLDGIGPGPIESVEVSAPTLLLSEKSRWDAAVLPLDGHGSVELDLNLIASCAIEGRVTDEDGRGLSGTELTVYLADPRPGESRTRTALSDAKGDYTFKGLRLCKGQVRPSKDGFNWGPPAFSPPTREASYEGGGSCFLLRAPGETTRLDFMMVPQTRSSAHGSLRGRVLDADGRPVEGAQVRLSPNTWSSRERTPHSDPVTSDSDGNFCFPAVSRDRSWSVRASTAEQVETTAVWDAEAGQEDEVVLTLRPAAVTAGRVVDENGDPVAYANVEVWATPGMSTGPPRRYLEARTLTNSEGRFRLLEAGHGHDASLQVFGWRLEQTDTMSAGFLGRGTRLGVAPSVADDLVLHVRRVKPLVFEGRVENHSGGPAAWKSLSFYVIESAGERRHYWPNPSVLAAETWGVVTDERGWFRLSRSFGDPAALAFTSEQLDEHSTAFEAGVHEDPMRLKQAESAPLRVQAQVLAPDGTPLDRGWVQLEGGRAVVVCDGIFHAEYVPTESDRTWLVTSPSHADGTLRGDVKSWVHGELPDSLQEPLLLELPRASQRHGRVVGPGGKGVPGIVVDAHEGGRRWRGSGDGWGEGDLHREWTMTDEHGRFHLARLDLATITVVVYPKRPGAEPIQVQGSDEQTSIEVRISR